MNSSCKCCKSFIYKSNLVNSTQINNHWYYEVPPSFTDEDYNYNEIDTSYLEWFGDLFKEKDDNIKLRQIHEEMFNIYVDKVKHVSEKTMKYYSKIISKFILFSPAVDPDDLEKFICFEFKLRHIEETQANKLDGTPLNYYNCIFAFLKHVYSSEYSQLYPKFSQQINKEIKQTDSIPSLLEITNAYVELMNIGKYEDAVTIHLIYSLGINPETLHFLTFNSIDDEGNIEYFDTQLERYLTIRLNESLLRDIKFLKDFKTKYYQKTDDSVRCFKDKYVFMGDFIFSVSISAIYSRFSRNFGGMLKWFKYTPHQIVKLSKAILLIVMKKNEQECLDLINDTIKFSQFSLR